MLVASLVVGLSVVLSYDWSGMPGTARFDPTVLLFGILVAATIMIASLYSPQATGWRLCPACGRRIPGDANLCPYCGHRFT